MGPRRYAPLSAEHRFWLRALPRFLAPRAPPRGIVRWLHGALVVPNVVFVSASPEYQTYLVLIFHRSRVAQLGHLICVPLGATLMLATAAHAHPIAGAALGVVFGAWWALVALLQRRWLWALVNVALATGLATIGFALARVLGSPWFWMTLVAALQAGSHATESHIPPRVGDADNWIPLAEFQRRQGALAPLPHWLYGTLDEWWATPRLIPVGTLFLLFTLGYARDLRERVFGFVRDAVASGQPALDYIGEGGGAYLDPTTLEPRENA
jgi:hypothetical protein